jgi:hypothetical protein
VLSRFSWRLTCLRHFRAFGLFIDEKHLTARATGIATGMALFAKGTLFFLPLSEFHGLMLQFFSASERVTSAL